MLILYPHGLGDCILLTPALRKYYNTFNEKVNVAILKRFESSEIFNHCPYIDNVYYVSDPWNDFKRSPDWNAVIDECKKFDDKTTMFILHKGHKIIDSSKCLSVELKDDNDFKTEIFISDEDKKQAKAIIHSLVGKNDYGFIQTNTGINGKTNATYKDLDENFGEKWLLENTDVKHFIEIGKSFSALDYNINIQFEIMNRARHVVLPDSVFYHACGALNKKVDCVTFKRKDVYERVKPLHKVEQNILFV